MDTDTILQLNQLNQAFYATTATEFDKTRNHNWPGWERISVQVPTRSISSVLDVGCGNGRFALFADDTFPNLQNYIGIDSSVELLNAAPKKLVNATTKYKHIDLIESLQSSTDLLETSDTFDLIVVFGVMHHIPSKELRKQLLARLSDALSPQGFLVFTTWQFMEFERFTRRLVSPNEVGIAPEDLENGDFLLDWRRGERAIRYCHYYTEEEVVDLLDATDLHLVQSYRADGKEGNVNRYYIVQKHSA